MAYGYVSMRTYRHATYIIVLQNVCLVDWTVSFDSNKINIYIIKNIDYDMTRIFTKVFN